MEASKENASRPVSRDTISASSFAEVVRKVSAVGDAGSFEDVMDVVAREVDGGLMAVLRAGIAGKSKPRAVCCSKYFG